MLKIAVIDNRRWPGSEPIAFNSAPMSAPPAALPSMRIVWTAALTAPDCDGGEYTSAQFSRCRMPSPTPHPAAPQVT